MSTQYVEPIVQQGQVARNNAGAPSFIVSDLDRVMRFLVLGTEGGTYYANEKAHTYQAFQGLIDAIQSDPKSVVDLIESISVSGRAASNDAALFSLAAVMAFAEEPEDKHYARSKLTKVARTGTHLFHFAQFVDNLKGWGTGTRKAFQEWYLSKTPDQVAYQAIKYNQRDGWSHRDLLRKAHPITKDSRMKAVFDVIAHPEKVKDYVGTKNSNLLPGVMIAAQLAKDALDVGSIVDLIKVYNLPREAIPTEFLNSPRIWETLLPRMGPEALIRNLGKMSSLKMLSPMSDNAKFVAHVLNDSDALSRARIHPLNVYKAFKTYQLGRGIKGSLAWEVSNTVTDALEGAFYKSFNFLVPSNKNILMGVDVSGSMSINFVPGIPNMSCREAAAIMALVTAKVEPYYHVMAFTGGFIPLDITKNDSLDSVQKKMLGLGYETTNCSLPMLYAQKHSLPVDCFQVYTDNETMVGALTPSAALREYRRVLSRPRAKSAIVTFSATKFTIADPLDPFMMDFVGFDSNAPQAMAEFVNM